jgi:hypothetical protein
VSLAHTTPPTVKAVGDISIGEGHVAAKMRTVIPARPSVSAVRIAQIPPIHEGVPVVRNEIIVQIHRRMCPQFQPQPPPQQPLKIAPTPPQKHVVNIPRLSLRQQHHNMLICAHWSLTAPSDEEVGCLGNNPEAKRLEEFRKTGVPWKKWGPYLSERQWGTVREDYSHDGNAWNYFTHD